MFPDIYSILDLLGWFIAGIGVGSAATQIILWIQLFRQGSGLTQRAADCGYACGYQEPYGFVPEAGCPVHDVRHNR